MPEFLGKQPSYRPQGGEVGRDYDRKEDPQKVVERETGGRTDHGVGRITDQRRRPPDIGEHCLSDQQRERVDPQSIGDQQRHGRNQNNHRKVVEKHRNNDRQSPQQHKQAPRRSGRAPGSLDRQILEHAGLAQHAHEHHHPEEQAERIEINGGESLSLRVEAHQEAGGHHCRGTDPGHDSVVNPIGHDCHECDEENGGCNPDAGHRLFLGARQHSVGLLVPGAGLRNDLWWEVRRRGSFVPLDRDEIVTDKLFVETRLRASWRISIERPEP